MTLVVDEMTGEAGYLTRLEAFVDLLKKRREGKRLENYYLGVDVGSVSTNVILIDEDNNLISKDIFVRRGNL